MSREPASVVTVKVATGTQLNYDGETYPSGAEVEAPADIAERWRVRGWAEPLEPASAPSKAPSRSRRTR